MVFSSPLFLFGFLPALYLLYLVVNGVVPRASNAVLLIGSLLFYAWGAPRFIPLFLLPGLLDFFLSHRIARPGTTLQHRRALLWISIAVNLLILGYFKYANFFVAQINDLGARLGFSSIAWASVALPIGISFITFEKISYIVDVYNERVPPARSFVDYLLFIALFPHLIAGPIFRYHDIQAQLATRTMTVDSVWSGVIRFCLGLSKKVLLADPLAAVADWAFQGDPTTLSTGYAWLGLICYALQIFLDFSGYSDMAIGLGRMFGFEFVENFAQPYVATSVTDFWRRWHISLSNWMREYLYIPLGGNRRGEFRTYLNLWIVFLLSGLWHGANWTFVIWGAFHGTFLVAERLYQQRASARLLPIVARRAVTFFIILLSWVFFRADSLHQAAGYLTALFGGGSGSRAPLLVEVLNNRASFVLLVALLLSLTPRSPNGVWSYFRTDRKERTELSSFAVLGISGLALAGFLASVLALTNSTFHPFIYFRF